MRRLLLLKREGAGTSRCARNCYGGNQQGRMPHLSGIESMCGRFVHWFAKTLALLMLISVVTDPRPPASIEHDGSNDQILASFRSTRPKHCISHEAW